jgi:hypothetical protein
MFNDTLTITHDSGDAISISLDGTGIEASMSVSTDSIEFGERWIESTSSENIWIHNTGNAPLLIDSIYCQGEGFEFTSGSMSIPALDSLMFAAPFTPADTLEYSGDLTIVTNIGNQVIAVAGHGIWTELAVEPEQIELFDLTPNEEVFRAIVLTSIGNTFIGDVSAELVVGGAFTVQDFPADSLPAYGTDSIVVRFLSTVDTAGIFFDTLIISSAVGDPIEIPLLADVFSGLSDNQLSIPNNFYLRQNYPNPFNPSTTLEFGLPVTSEVSLKVYDLQGRLVEEILNASLGAGHHSVVWNCSSCASGLYLFILNTPEQPFARKAMLLK